MPRCIEGCSTARHESSNALHERFEHTVHQKRDKSRQDPCYFVQARKAICFYHPPATEVLLIASFHRRALTQSEKSPEWQQAHLKLLQREFSRANGRFLARARRHRRFRPCGLSADLGFPDTTDHYRSKKRQSCH